MLNLTGKGMIANVFRGSRNKKFVNPDLMKKMILKSRKLKSFNQKIKLKWKRS